MGGPTKISDYLVEDRGFSTPCWIWMRGITGNGYGNYCCSSTKQIGAHRFYYTKYKGPIPEGFEIDHLCGIKCCVNPEHLEVKSISAHRKKHPRKGRVWRKEVLNGRT